MSVITEKKIVRCGTAELSWRLNTLPLPFLCWAAAEECFWLTEMLLRSSQLVTGHSPYLRNCSHVFEMANCPFICFTQVKNNHWEVPGFVNQKMEMANPIITSIVCGM